MNKDLIDPEKLKLLIDKTEKMCELVDNLYLKTFHKPFVKDEAIRKLNIWETQKTVP